MWLIVDFPVWSDYRHIINESVNPFKEKETSFMYSIAEVTRYLQQCVTYYLSGCCMISLLCKQISPLIAILSCACFELLLNIWNFEEKKIEFVVKCMNFWKFVDFSHIWSNLKAKKSLIWKCVKMMWVKSAKWENVSWIWNKIVKFLLSFVPSFLFASWSCIHVCLQS